MFIYTLIMCIISKILYICFVIKHCVSLGSFQNDQFKKPHSTQETPIKGRECAVNQLLSCNSNECRIEDDSRPITVAVQAEAVNHLSVLA